MTENENIIPINIEDEMRGAYIDYSMSVIISRALPDVRDGLKPVHRRVLYGMSELGVFYNRPYKKSARIVGEVLGKYHPHGDASVYDTMVRMAQPWSLRYPLVDGQGNFGSLDGDSPAAMRYTEARLKQIAGEMLADINKNTVDFQPNFDDSLEEPSVMPSKLPNLLVNGSSGIAVGMATNMAPHNLSEVVDGIVAYIDNPSITVQELMQFIKAPDFPTGGIIYGYDGVKKAFETGRGRIVVRSVTNFETTSTGKTMIVVTEIPYQINKALLIEKVAELVNEKKIEGISAIRDESDRQGIRIVFELRKDAVPEVVLNTLFKHTLLQATFNVNNVALVGGRPATLSLKELIRYYVQHRHDVVVRRTKFDLDDAQKRLHILEGYLTALDHLDEVIQLIRQAKDPEEAKTHLITTFGFSDVQAKAILDLRLQRLTNMEREKIVQEHREVTLLVADLQDILASQPRRMAIIKDELKELKEKYGDPRRTQIVFDTEDLDVEDMIAEEDMVITISKDGYIKRTSLKEYRQQGRGGVGSRGVGAKEDDYTEHLFVANTHDYLLFFTNKGKVLWLKTYQVPEGNKTSKGRPLQNLIVINSDEKVQAILKVKTLQDEEYINNHYVVLCTVQGTIKKTSLEAYSRPRKDGIIAINLNEGDRLLNAALTDGTHEIIIACSTGKAIRFDEETVRPMGRSATGVKGIEFSEENDYVVGMVCVKDAKTATLLVVSEKGYGKRSEVEEYRKTNRGGKGVTTLNITEKTGKLISIQNVTDDNDLMIMTKAGIAIRMRASAISVQGRNTQGVRLIKLNEGDEISSVTAFEVVEEETAPENDAIHNNQSDVEVP